jgi:hypothetical protein
MGIGFAVFMFLLLGILFPLATGEARRWEKTFLAALLWSVAGTTVGFTMKIWMGKRARNALQK